MVESAQSHARRDILARAAIAASLILSAAFLIAYAVAEVMHR
jgi:hypothetical protein